MDTNTDTISTGREEPKREARLRLKDRGRVPFDMGRARWRFYVEGTNVWLEARTFRDLVQLTGDHRNANDLAAIPWDELSEVVENQIARRLPPTLSYGY